MEQTAAIKLIVDACMRVKPGQDVLVVADDYARPEAIAQAVASAARERGAAVVYMVVPPNQISGQEPGKTTAAAMMAADVIFVASEMVLNFAHSTALDEIKEKGIGLYATLGLSEDYLRKPISMKDIVEMKERSERIAALYNQADTIRLTSSYGTDLTMSISGRQGMPLHPIGGIFVPDYSECPVAPIEGTAKGILVCDGEIGGWGHTLSRPLVLKVARGKVVDISGNAEDAERLKKTVSTDSGASNIAEFAIGTSQTVPERLSGARYDFAILGSVHIGLGRNTLLGGRSMSKIHVDGIMTSPTVQLDGKTIVESGQVLV